MDACKTRGELRWAKRLLEISVGDGWEGPSADLDILHGQGSAWHAEVLPDLKWKKFSLPCPLLMFLSNIAREDKMCFSPCLLSQECQAWVYYQNDWSFFSVVGSLAFMNCPDMQSSTAQESWGHNLDHCNWETNDEEICKGMKDKFNFVNMSTFPADVCKCSLAQPCPD